MPCRGLGAGDDPAARLFFPKDDFGEVYPALARDGDTLIGMCQLTVQKGWVNGEEARMGYLSSLRVVPKYRNHLKVLQAGFSPAAAVADTGSLLHQYCGK